MKKKKHIGRWILILLLCLALVPVLVINISSAYMISHPSVRSLEETYENEKQKGYLRDYDDWEKEEYTVTSFDGYVLHCEYLPNPEPSNKYIVISHGIQYTRYGSVQFAHFFREQGFNCIIYDLRGHGANEKTATTYGVKESRDLIAIIDDLHDTYGDDIRLGLLGESMGAGTQILALQYHPDVDFVINDCGYADLGSVFENFVTSRVPISGKIVIGPSIVSKLFYGFSYYGVRPIDCLADNEIPICFMHGKEDELIPCEHSVRMSKATKGYSELHLFEGAWHTASWPKNQDEYEAIEKEFLEAVDPTLLD